MIRTDPLRPPAADAANAILYACLPKSELKNAPPETHSHFFLQNVYIRDRYAYKKIPIELRKVLNTGRKHDVRFNALQLSTTHKMELPIWNHIGATEKPTMEKETAVCLQKRHNVHSVGNALLNITQAENTRDHRDWDPFCPCEACKEVRGEGCLDPKRCIEAQTSMLSVIAPKFDPNDITATERVETEYKKDIQIKRGVIIPFNKTLNNSKHLADNLRVFSKLNHPEPADEMEPDGTEDLQHQADIPIHTDGSCIDNGSNYACAGSGIWFGQNDPRNISIRVGDNLTQSNNTGEMLAVLEAARRVPATANIHIKTD
ncbi:hypothetical protein DL93DRAFT_2146956, partial [Clavulina sp. PMI_390]